MRRRNFIRASAAVGVAGITGCVEDGGEEDGEDPGNDTGNGSTDGETPDEPDGGGEDDTTSDDGLGSVEYGGLYSYDSEYAVEADLTGPDTGESGTIEGRYHDGDHYLEAEMESFDGVFEVHKVGDDEYYVLNGEECFLNPGSAMRPDTDPSSESDAQSYGEKPDVGVQPDGTTEIDGEPVYVFEVSGEDVEGSYTIYLSQSTGYMRRVEGDFGTADFHSWGDTEPISPPDMECQDVSGF